MCGLSGNVRSLHSSYNRTLFVFPYKWSKNKYVHTKQMKTLQTRTINLPLSPVASFRRVLGQDADEARFWRYFSTQTYFS